MEDPVMCMDGQSYERRAIEQWLRSKSTSPATGARLPSKVLVPNLALRHAIEDFRAQRSAIRGRSSFASSLE
jgi:hypothetical protein